MIKIGMHELERARRLQEEAARLHLPSPPVVSFKISREANGKVEDLIHAKSNSYLRNAYNLLSHVLIFTPNSAQNTSYFGDGAISAMTSTGRITSPPQIPSLGATVDLVLGTNGTPDTLDDIALTPIPSGDWTGSLNRFSTFDSASRRFITIITRNMYNRSQNTHQIKESGIYLLIGGTDYYLMIRDTFPAVTFAPGNNITFTYQLEVYYPPVS